MRSFPIHKNLSLYHWLRRRIEKVRALRVSNAAEKIIVDIEIFLVFRFLAVGGLALFWTFLVYLNVTSFLKHLRGWIRETNFSTPSSLPPLHSQDSFF